MPTEKLSGDESPTASKFSVTYHPPTAPWPDGIQEEIFDNCYSKNEAINRFIELKGADLAERIIEIYPLNWIIEIQS